MMRLATIPSKSCAAIAWNSASSYVPTCWMSGSREPPRDAGASPTPISAADVAQTSTRIFRSIGAYSSIVADYPIA